MKNSPSITIATRGSKLALWQAQHVAELITSVSQEVSVKIKIVSTQGDRILDRTLSEIGGKGLFVKEVEAELLSKSADIAVHSLKDLTSDMPDELHIPAYPKREDPRDALVSVKYSSYREIPAGETIGTSSLRRSVLVGKTIPGVKIQSLRGNVDSRLKKLEDDNYGAILLAAAGLRRLGWEQHIREYLPLELFIPAVGQGTLALQCRRDDSLASELLSRLDHPETRVCTIAERAFLAEIEGSCRTPLGCNASLMDGKLTLRAFIGSPSGSPFLQEVQTGSADTAEIMGRDLALKLLSDGGDQILKSLHG